MGGGCFKADNADDCSTPFQSIYEVTAKDIDGETVSFEAYRGKVLIIVNVACR